MNTTTTKTPAQAMTVQQKPADPEDRKPTASEFEIVLQRDHDGVFSHPVLFDHAQRVAKLLVASPMAPEVIRGPANVGTAVIVIDMSTRLRMNPLMVAQSIYKVYDKHGWESKFQIACANCSPKFEPLMWDVRKLGKKTVQYGQGKVEIDDIEFICWTVQKGEKLTKRTDGKRWTCDLAKEAGYVVYDGPPVTLTMAVEEGWYTKNGSKWRTMPDLMGRYRSAAFFVRLHAPELTMGMPTVDELVDIAPEKPATPAPKIEAPSFITLPPVAATPEPPAPANVASLPEEEPEPPKDANEERRTTPQGDTAAKVDPTAHLDSKGVLDLLFEFMKRDGVTEDQVLGHLKAVKVAKHHKELAELSDSKCRTLAAAWDREVVEIRKIQI